jgi:hypothetical protein
LEEEKKRERNGKKNNLIFPKSPWRPPHLNGFFVFFFPFPFWRSAKSQKKKEKEKEKPQKIENRVWVLLRAEHMAVAHKSKKRKRGGRGVAGADIFRFSAAAPAGRKRGRVLNRPNLHASIRYPITSRQKT